MRGQIRPGPQNFFKKPIDISPKVVYNILTNQEEETPMKTKYFLNDEEISLEELDALACNLKPGQKIYLDYVFDYEVHFVMELS